MRKQTFKTTSAALPLLLFLQMAHGDEPATTAHTTDSQWLLLASPFVWAPSMSGQAALGGVNTKVDVPFADVWENLSSVFMGNLELTNRTLGFYVDGVHAKTDQSERVYGRKLGLAITQSTLAVGAYYRAYEYELGGETIFGEPRAWRIEPTAGVRWTKLSTKLHIDSLGFSTKKKTEWTDPFIGLRMHADLTDRWTLSSGLRYQQDRIDRQGTSVLAPLGRRLDESSPMVDARLPDGSRVNAIIPPKSWK